MAVIVTNARGDVLAELITEVDEAQITSGRFEPLTHALVVLRFRGQFLFLFNRSRRNWEIPGGCIDPGESPRDCAARELLDETGQAASRTEFAGVMRFRKFPDGRTEFGALFRTELESMTELLPNDEAEQLRLWDLESHIGPVDKIDVALCRLLTPDPT